MDEEWVEITYQGKSREHTFVVSNLGTVINPMTGRTIGGIGGKHKRQNNGEARYRRIAGSDFSISIHNLVWDVFGDKPRSEGMEVDHIDFDGMNNRIDNLQLLTRKENRRRRRTN